MTAGHLSRQTRTQRCLRAAKMGQRHGVSVFPRILLATTRAGLKLRGIPSPLRSSGPALRHAPRLRRFAGWQRWRMQRAAQRSRALRRPTRCSSASSRAKTRGRRRSGRRPARGSRGRVAQIDVAIFDALRARIVLSLRESHEPAAAERQIDEAQFLRLRGRPGRRPRQPRRIRAVVTVLARRPSHVGARHSAPKRLNERARSPHVAVA